MHVQMHAQTITFRFSTLLFARPNARPSAHPFSFFNCSTRSNDPNRITRIQDKLIDTKKAAESGLNVRFKAFYPLLVLRIR